MQPEIVPQNPVGPSVFPRVFSALGWFLAATWLYIHGFVLAANRWPEYQPYLDGLLWRIFKAATVVGWGLSPFWVVAATILVLSSFRRKQRPALGAVLLLVICLIGAYLALGFILD